MAAPINSRVAWTRDFVYVLGISLLFMTTTTIITVNNPANVPYHKGPVIYFGMVSLPAGSVLYWLLFYLFLTDVTGFLDTRIVKHHVSHHISGVETRGSHALLWMIALLAVFIATGILYMSTPLVGRDFFIVYSIVIAFNIMTVGVVHSKDIKEYFSPQTSGG